MKKFVLLPLYIVLVFILLGVTYATPKNVIHMSARWSKHYESIADMAAHADLVIVGKVVASRQEQRHDLIFTMQTVKIIVFLLGECNKNDTVDLLQTGGSLGETTTIEFAENPLMNPHDQYLLFLEKTEDGYYLVAGGYQGSYIVKDNIIQVNTLQKDDVVGKVMSGKSMSDFAADFSGETLVETTQAVTETSSRDTAEIIKPIDDVPKLLMDFGFVTRRDKEAELFNQQLGIKEIVRREFNADLFLIVFNQDQQVDGVSGTMTPLQVLQAKPHARLMQLSNENWYQIEFLFLNAILPQSIDTRVIVVVPESTYTLVMVTANENDACGPIAAFPLMQQSDVQSFLSRSFYQDSMPAKIIYSSPEEIQSEQWDSYETILQKQTDDKGVVSIKKIVINRMLWSFRNMMDINLSYGSFYQPDANRYADPSPDDRTISIAGERKPIDDFLTFELTDTGILIKNRNNGDLSAVPLSARHLRNISEFSQWFDVRQLFILEPLHAEQGSPQTYALKALFAWKVDYWDNRATNTYADVALLTVKAEENNAVNPSIRIESKYTDNLVLSKQELSLTDFSLGPITACMQRDDFLTNIASEGASELELQELKDKLSVMDFGTVPYNGIDFRYHGLASCINGFSYAGSAQDYRTPRGIGIGSNKEAVVAAYGMPDVGLMQTDEWVYFLDKAYWSSIDIPLEHFGDAFTFRFADYQVVGIECSVFISGS